MKFLLRDRNPALVAAWRKEFVGSPDVEVSQGDIFDLTADAIVSPANSFGFMDGGIDLVYSQRFGWTLQKRLQQLLRDEYDGELPVGQAVIVPTDDADIPLVISAPMMRVPMDISNTVNAYLAFRAAIRAARAYNTTEKAIESILSRTRHGDRSHPSGRVRPSDALRTRGFFRRRPNASRNARSRHRRPPQDARGRILSTQRTQEEDSA